MPRANKNKKRMNYIQKAWFEINIRLLLNHGWSFDWWLMNQKIYYKAKFRCSKGKHETKEVKVTWNVGQVPYEESVTYQECTVCRTLIFQDSYDKELYLKHNSIHKESMKQLFDSLLKHEEEKPQ